MTIDISRHKTILFQLLKEIYSDTKIAPYVGFKGGTAALMFYGLDRFSIDLDFDLLDPGQSDIVFEQVGGIVKRYGDVKEALEKRFSLFYLLAYDDKSRNVKIEISKRQYGSAYEIKTYLGVSMQVMVIEDMFAHKLMTMYERIGETSRDIYDVWYFLRSRFPINKDIVEKRSGKSFDELVTDCIGELKKMESRHILDGLGELITPNQKDWAREKLREETIAFLTLRLSSQTM